MPDWILRGRCEAAFLLARIERSSAYGFPLFSLYFRGNGSKRSLLSKSTQGRICRDEILIIKWYGSYSQ